MSNELISGFNLSNSYKAEYTGTLCVYFFRGDLATHVDQYLSWVEIVSRYMDAIALTVIPPRVFLKQHRLVCLYRAKGVKVLVAPKILTSIVAALFLLKRARSYSKVVVHHRKRSTQAVSIANHISNKFKSIVDFEGDPLSEARYLAKEKVDAAPKNTEINKIRKRMRRKIISADSLIVQTKDFKTELLKREFDLFKTPKAITVLPAGFDEKAVFFDPNLRRSVRTSLQLSERYVLIYIGNVCYRWQNFPLMVKFIANLKRARADISPFFIVLTPSVDYGIAKAAVEKGGLDSRDFLIKHVEYYDVNSYLNAADIGLVLRDNHPMNRYATTGKLGEYLAAGLDVVATKHIGLYSDLLLRDGFANIIDIGDVLNRRLLEDLQPLSFAARKSRSRWAHDHFSSRAFVDEYLECLRNL